MRVLPCGSFSQAPQDLSATNVATEMAAEGADLKLSQQPSLHPLLSNRRDRLLVERDKRLAAQPPALVGNHAIGKIRASPQDSETSLNCRIIQYNILDPA